MPWRYTARTPSACRLPFKFPSQERGRFQAARQVNIAELNDFTAIGTPITEPVERLCPGKGDVQAVAELCDKAIWF